MNTQPISIEVDPLTAAKLQSQAEAKGLTLSAWLRLLAESLNGTPVSSGFETASPEERARAVEAWASQTRSSAPPLSDTAVSRESIYAEREDKQV